MYESLFNRQKQFYQSGKTKKLSFRIEALKQLKRSIQYYESDLLDAMKKDFNKGKAEAYLTEIGYVYNEINYSIKHIEEWAETRKVKTPVTHIGSTSKIYKEPYGVTLIIAPWNYPFNLTVAPLIGAVSAGNTAILKPSEHTPTVAGVISSIVALAFPEKYVASVEGGIDTNQDLLNLPFNYIFYTGSSQVGRIVMESAARHLTPVTLELGGKSPAIVTKNADIKLAAKRIVWGKFINAGQTCVAPDFVYVDSSVRKQLIHHMKHYTEKFYAEAFITGAYMNIVNENHFERLKELIQGNVVYGGKTRPATLTIEPTIIDNVDFSHDAMQEEVFGPILPVLQFDSLEKAILDVRDLPDPLALYVFTDKKSEAKTVIQSVPFGGGAVNDTVFHLVNPHLPFGGRGNSGMGKYHGKYSFDTFTHEKSILHQTTCVDFPFRYPNKLFGKFIKYLWK
ncbi:aldehyde dehydrogenase [Salinicoccus hispanicus]|uniref:Aldehyde dehydrogenase n=1 Tax=Salinicoccus hispanicus TaxID=157225 RepID=A0A6N8U7V0_9STAP|nr:aldehyde dehydrogenase [Salinicoccus hispanicus]MXQ51729.1 aldehyde dehydrogenase family protein [Salinicoccus hispanicus]